MVEEKLIYDGYVKIYDVRKEKDGKVIEYTKVHLRGASCGIVINEEGKMALVTQYRPIIGMETLEVPAGTLDKGISPKEIIIEELEEECGIAKEDIISITDKPEDNNRQNTILFLGDSLTYNYKINEFFEGYKTFNSGISGNKTTDILNDLENRVYKYNSTKVFLLIGINDLKNGISNDEVLNTILRQYEMLIQEKGEYTAVREMRKHVAWYVKGMKSAKAIKTGVNEFENFEEVKKFLLEYFK